jgi:GDP-L-fucose synthase
MTIKEPINPFDLADRRVFVAGHTGMVGSALVRRLSSEGCDIRVAERREVDLRRQTEAETWVQDNRIDVMFLAAATVGGIQANASRPAEFIYDNLAIEVSLIEAARQSGVQKLLFLGSSCIYPKHTSQPIPEEALLSGPLEETNQWYSIAKIAGLKLCQAYRKQYGCDFISIMPTNLYGPNDSFDPLGGHVIPALMLKAHRAKASGAAFMEVWGSGRPRREFLHVDDLADACVHLMKSYSDAMPINVGVGQDISIFELAEMIADVVGFKGELKLDASRPDGAPRKLLDVTRLSRSGWQARTPLRVGLEDVYAWFLKAEAEGVLRGA